MQLSLFEKNLFSLLLLASVVHGIYLAVLLFARSRRDRELRWLGVLMAPVSLLMVTYLLYVSDAIRAVPHLLGVFAPTSYLIGPALYVFIRRASDPDFRVDWRDLLHLAPALWVLWRWIPVYGLPAGDKLVLIERILAHARPSFWQLVWGNQLMWHMLAYTLGAWLVLVRQQKAASAGDVAALRLGWLRHFMLAFGGIVVVQIGVQVLFWGLSWPAASMELVLLLIMAAALHVLGYVVLGKEEVLPAAMAPKKYATSPLTPVRIAELEGRIAAYLEASSPWLDPEFSVADLAAGLAVPRHHVSQVLSEGMDVSFYDLVNGYRIEEVKKRLQAGEAERYSLMGVANACGFRSRSSFSRAFRKMTGSTPTDYLKRVVEGEASSG